MREGKKKRGSLEIKCYWFCETLKQDKFIPSKEKKLKTSKPSVLAW